MVTKPEPLVLKMEDIVKDPLFCELVKKRLNDIVSKRRIRPLPPLGKRYIRDWYDRMSSEGKLSHDFFIDNIMGVWQKRSTLSSEVRSVIKYVCDSALTELINKHQQPKNEATQLAQA